MLHAWMLPNCKNLLQLSYCVRCCVCCCIRHYIRQYIYSALSWEKYNFEKQTVIKNGADNGTRTRGLNLGKVALYQLSYVRKQMNSLAYSSNKCKLGMS